MAPSVAFRDRLVGQYADLVQKWACQSARRYLELHLVLTKWCPAYPWIPDLHQPAVLTVHPLAANLPHPARYRRSHQN